MREIEIDPARLRAYFWRIATNARRMAAKERARTRRGFAPDDVIGADTLDAFAAAILENLDAMVKTTVREGENDEGAR